MSRFGKKKEEQLTYQNAKLEAANKEMQTRINDELIPALKEHMVANNQKAILIALLLYELGGIYEAKVEDLNSMSCTVRWEKSQDGTTIKFYIAEGDDGNEASTEERKRTGELHCQPDHGQKAAERHGDQQGVQDRRPE